MKMSQLEIDQTINLHVKWLRGEPGGVQANLTGANLTRADLTRANLTGANLTGANLIDANLTGAYLIGANLTGANLTRADLTRADLTRADLTDAKNIWFPMACPDTGSFIAWKKAILNDGAGCYAIIKLRIFEDSKRSSSTGRQCRADKAEVLEIRGIDDGALKNYAVSKYDANFHYIPGKIVTVPDFDNNRWEECAPGIHFFIDRQEAVNCCL